MTKGDDTRQAILREAFELATVEGLEGVTIGALAQRTEMSKSGLFAHFGSKESLQVDTLRMAADRFAERVVVPAIRESAGIPRVRALFDRWLAWGAQLHGGCIFVSSAAEYDDREGAARDFLVEKQREWIGTIVRVARRAVEVGDFRPDLDPEQFAHELYSIYLGYHFSLRLMRDPAARTRARRAFEALILHSSSEDSDVPTA